MSKSSLSTVYAVRMYTVCETHRQGVMGEAESAQADNRPTGHATRDVFVGSVASTSGPSMPALVASRALQRPDRSNLIITPVSAASCCGVS